MELTFPFKNLTVADLLKFFEVDIIKDYYDAEDKDAWVTENFNVNFFKNLIPDFENEILQVIETTNQETIDNYFIKLSENIQYVKDLLTKDHLSELINNWNDIQLLKFESTIKEKEKVFLDSPIRKLKHLETYEQEPSPFQLIRIHQPLKKTLQTNYNYYCVQEKLDFIDIAIVSDYLNLLKELAQLFIDTSKKYGIRWEDGEIKANDVPQILLKPILFCEGDIDIILIKKAATLLNKTELIAGLELRQRGSCNNLDKLWTILTDNNWETVPQTKILLYDCDTNRIGEDFGHIFRRTIPKIEANVVQRGIENLFPPETIEKAVAFKKEFVDYEKIIGTKRGISYEENKAIINKDEKRNFSNWILENGTKEDFIHFDSIFNILEKILEP